MDFNIELLWLVFVGLYFLLGSRRRKIQRQKQSHALPSDEVTRPTADRPPTPFQEFVRQMETAMREASGEPAPPTPAPRALPPAEEPATATRTSVPTARVIPPSRLGSASGDAPGAFHGLGSFERELRFEEAARPAHEIHSFGADNPFSEEAFEHLARGRDITEHAPGHLQASPHAPLRPRRSAPGTHASYWRQRLTDPRHAQDALVLSEIFGGPWTPRRPGRN